MAKLSIAERIAQLEARKQALKARLSKQERTIDTRRKVLLGALLLDTLERGATDALREGEDREWADALAGWVRRELPGFLTRPNDHTLFPEFIIQTSDDAFEIPASPSNPDPHVSLDAQGDADGYRRENPQ